MGYAQGALGSLMSRAEDGMALVVTPLDHARVHRGDIWVYPAVSGALNAGQTYVIHLKIGAVDEAHLIFSAFGTGQGEVELYEGPTKSGDGTGVTAVNRMRITARQVALTSTLYHTPTTSANGTLLCKYAFGGGQNSPGGVREDEWVLKPSTSYLLILTSRAASNTMGAMITLYEK